MEKQFVIDDITLKDSWRLFHILAEFVEGFENLSDIKPAITIFGSARTGKATISTRRPITSQEC